MDKLDGEKLVQRYTDWIRDYSETNTYEDKVCEITLPFLNRRRSCIQVYVSRTESGLMVSDEGETIGDLRFCGFDIDDTETRRRTLESLLRSFSVKLEGKDELRVYTSEEELPDYMNELAQCMLAVDRMIFSTSPAKVARLAEEDTQAAQESKKKPLAAKRSPAQTR